MNEKEAAAVRAAMAVARCRRAATATEYDYDTCAVHLGVWTDDGLCEDLAIAVLAAIENEKTDPDPRPTDTGSGAVGLPQWMPSTWRSDDG